MTFGLQIVNPSGELVFSSDAKGQHCIGKAVLQGAVVQPTGSPTGGHPGRVTGYSVYRISHSGAIAVALDLPLNKRVGLIDVVEVSSGTWDITVHCGDTPDANDFDTIEYAVDVWAFGFFDTPSGDYGLRIWDESGNLAWDLARANPLFARGFVDLSLNTGSIPSLTRPVCVGAPSTWTAFDQFVSFNHRIRWEKRGAWKRTSSTSLADVQYTARRFEYFGPDGTDTEGDVCPSSAIIVEGSTLP
jgi:hypothetical protein